MPTLRPMNDDDFARFLAIAIPAYASDKVRSGQWTAGEALGMAGDEMLAALPQQQSTPGHFLRVLEDDTGADVGTLWYAVEPRAGVDVAYLYDIRVRPEHRRIGHAAAAFAALEREVAALGCSGIALHVFGHNAEARALYDKLGFTTTNVNLYRPVDPAHRAAT